MTVALEHGRPPTTITRYLPGAAVVGALVAAAAVLPVTPILATFALVIVITVVLKPRYDAALLLLVFLGVVAVVPAPLTVSALRSIGAPTVLLGLAAGAMWAVDWLAPREVTDRRYRPVPLIVVGFVGANIASYTAAGLRAADIVEVNAADRGMITILAAAGVALLAAETVSSRSRLELVMSGVVLAGTFIACVGIIQFSTGFDLAASIHVPGLDNTSEAASFIAERSIFRRVAGTTMHAIEFSAVLCMVLPIALHLAMNRSRRWYAAVALIGIALPMSVSRTAVVGLASVVIVLVPSWPRPMRRRFYVGLAVYLVGMRLLIPGLLGTIRALFADAEADPSVSSRQTDYEYVTQFTHDHPYFGRGFATFIPTRYDFLDNQYLLSLVETGFVGATAYIVLLCGCAIAALVIKGRATSVADRRLAQALVASLAVAASTSAAFDFLSFPTARALLFIVIGCVGALWRLFPTAERPTAMAGRPLPYISPPTTRFAP
jgi:hypothetical protein